MRGGPGPGSSTYTHVQAQPLGTPKVNQLDLTVRHEHDVAPFDVPARHSLAHYGSVQQSDQDSPQQNNTPVNNIVGMEILHSFQNLACVMAEDFLFKSAKSS